MQSIKHQGIAAYNPKPQEYSVFRDVKDFGAKGDGINDDTAAINAAISSGNRCGLGCPSTTIAPAIVYFPKGVYVISTPIITLYYTQLIGDAKTPPTLLATASFEGMAVIDADPYIPGGGGAQYYVNQNNFFRSVRNFVIDLRQIPAEKFGTGLHWQVSQATSLFNIVVHMSTAPNTAHQGIFMENGSGGLMSDLVFNGGKFGIWVGNQQFTVRNITINNAQTAIYSIWNWGWTFQGVQINNCQVGFDLSTGGLTSETQTVGAEAIIDATVTKTSVFVRTSKASNRSLAGSLVLNNVQLIDVPVAVGVVGGAVVLPGGTTTISCWGQGNVYTGINPVGTFVQDSIHMVHKPSVLLDDSGNIFGKTHPQYADYSVTQFISVRDHGAKGDGKTDDTAALKDILRKFAGCKIIFFDAGTYIVSSTITIPAGARVVGEAWSVIAGSGHAFLNQDEPQVVVRVGEKGSQGVVEITDMLFTTVGPAPGAIVVEWNVRQPAGHNGGAGMWDTHIRLGGARGTNLEVAQCPRNDAGEYSRCCAAFLALHLTSRSTAYLEGTWVWLADHDLDGNEESNITIYAGRGILSESLGPVWMIGTASEHFVLYQYNLAGARNHYMGLIQTESPYFQPDPAPPTPFRMNSLFKDPNFDDMITSAWAVTVSLSHDIIIFGAGLYSFFRNYEQDCLATSSCQSQVLNIDSTSSISIYSLSTVGTTYQLSVNGRGIINQNQNTNGFASTVTTWRI